MVVPDGDAASGEANVTRATGIYGKCKPVAPFQIFRLGLTGASVGQSPLPDTGPGDGTNHFSSLTIVGAPDVPRVSSPSDLPIGQGLLSKRSELVRYFDWIDPLGLIDSQSQPSLTANHQEILDQCRR